MRMESPLFNSSQLIELHCVHTTDVITYNKIYCTQYCYKFDDTVLRLIIHYSMLSCVTSI